MRSRRIEALEHGRRGGRRVQLGRSLGAGIVGTAVMTGYQLAVARARGGPVRQRVPRTWAEAPAPARVARELAVTTGHGSWLTKKRAPAANDAVHWAYGVGWGTLYGLLARRRGESAAGAATLGAGLWGLSYAALVPAGIYEPPWRYPLKELSIDLSYHLVYGAAVAGTLAALDR
jgi:hypothetical protein